MGRALLLVLLAFALRLYRPDAQSLWFDEAWTAFLASRPLAAIPEIMARVDTHPPLFTLLLGVWVRLAGGSDLALRAFSGLLGTLTVPLSYWAGRRLVSPRGALLGTSLVAIAPFLVYYSQEVRVYALLAPAFVLLLGLTASRCRAPCVKNLRLAGRPFRQGLVFGLAASFFLLSFYSVALPWLAATLLAGAAGLAGRRRRAALARLAAPEGAAGAGLRPLNRWAAGHLLGLAPLLLWLPGVLAQREALGRLSRVQEPLAGIPGYLSWVGHYLTAGPPALPFEHPLPAWVYLATVLTALTLGAVRRPALALATALPLAASLALLAAFGGSGPHPRYLIWLLPAGLLLAGEGLAWLSRHRRLLAAGLLAGCVLASGVTLARYFHDPRYARDDFRAVARQLEASLGPDDLALFEYVDYAVLRYYRARAPLLFLGPRQGLPAYDPALASYWPPQVVPDAPAAVLDRLEEELTPERRVALVSWYWIARQDPLAEYALELAGHRQETRQAGAHALRYYRITRGLDLPEASPQPIRWERAALGAVALPPAVPAGEALPVALDWTEARGPLGVRLIVRDAQAAQVAASDGPLMAGRHHQLVPLPAWLPPGRYPVALRLYDAASLQPLEIDLARVEATLGTVEVGPPRPELAARELPEDAPPAEAVTLPGLTIEAFQLVPAGPAWGQRLELTLWVRVEEPARRRLEVRAGPASTGLELDLRRWPAGSLVRLRTALALPAEPADGGPPPGPRGSGLPLQLAWAGQTATLLDLQPTRPPAASAPPPEHVLDVRFGDFVRLTGFDLAERTYSAAGPVPLVLHWEVTGTPPGLDLAVFTHLLDAQGQLVGQHDGVPAAGQAPVPGWTPGQVILDPHPMTLREPYAGPARIEVGLYDPASGDRVRLPDGRDHLLLPVEIEIR